MVLAAIFVCYQTIVGVGATFVRKIIVVRGQQSALSKKNFPRNINSYQYSNGSELILVRSHNNRTIPSALKITVRSKDMFSTICETTIPDLLHQTLTPKGALSVVPAPPAVSRSFGPLVWAFFACSRYSRVLAYFKVLVPRY